MMPLLLIAVLGYFLLFRPAQTQEKQRRAMVAALKKNDEVVTSGGIIGVVDSIKEKKDEVVLRGGLRVTKSSIVRVITEETAKEQ
jgi:preprotein translocase subunit YajC